MSTSIVFYLCFQRTWSMATYVWYWENAIKCCSYGIYNTAIIKISTTLDLNQIKLRFTVSRSGPDTDYGLMVDMIVMAMKIGEILMALILDQLWDLDWHWSLLVWAPVCINLWGVVGEMGL